MSSILNRRSVGVLLFAPALVGCGAAASKTAASMPDDMAMGSPRAKVTVVEYASVACPVCGKWYREVFPAFKAKYIDTNKINFVSREMLVGSNGEMALAAAGFLLARCAGRDRYFKVADAIYRTQDSLYNDPRSGLMSVAKSFGMDERNFDACVQDESSLKALNARVEANAKRDNVDATPTFVINGIKMQAGYQALPAIDAAIDRAAKSA